MALPQFVLPKLSKIAKSPPDAMAEIRSTLNQTAANVEGSLPRIGGESTKRFPRVSSLIKNLEERLPFKVPTMINIVERVESPIEDVMARIGAPPTPERGTIEEMAEATSVGIPTRGSL